MTPVWWRQVGHNICRVEKATLLFAASSKVTVLLTALSMVSNRKSYRPTHRLQTNQRLPIPSAGAARDVRPACGCTVY